MKNRCILIIISALLLFNVECTSSQSNDDEAAIMLERFYVEYNNFWSSDIEFSDLEKKLLSLQKQNCTKKLQSKLKEFYQIHGFDHDLMINDLYTDSLTLKKTLVIKKHATEENSYLVSYLAILEEPSGKSIERDVKIIVNVIKEDGVYKIDEVK